MSLLEFFLFLDGNGNELIDKLTKAHTVLLRYSGCQSDTAEYSCIIVDDNIVMATVKQENGLKLLS